MTVVCSLSKKPLTSVHSDGDKPPVDAVNVLTVYVKQAHPAEHRGLEQDLRTVQELLAGVPAYMMLDRFAEADDSRTSAAFKQMAEGIERAMQEISEIWFGVEESEAAGAVASATR